MKLIAFCEAHADFRLMAGMVDRMLRELGPRWIVDNIDSPETVRTWQTNGEGTNWFDIHQLDRYTDVEGPLKLRVPSVHGHFNGKPGRAGGVMARKALRIAHALHKKYPEEPIAAVVLLWDADHQLDERTEGVNAARDEARGWAPFEIVYGIPDPEREAWILAGYDPLYDAEQRELAELHRELGFSPIERAEQLRDREDGGLRSIKRVLDRLVGKDLEREARCWTDPPLATLRARGADTGLAAFLDELAAMIRAVFNLPPTSD